MQAPQETARASRSDWLQAGGIAAALFALYALTSPRTVSLEDDALFILSSYFLGIEHPPGYPLFTLVGHLFSHLPFGSAAYRVHLASALFGALAGGAAWLCARTLVSGRLAACVAAVGLGVTPVFWSQAIIAEVYTLNTLFLLVLMYLGLRLCPPHGAAPAAQPASTLPWMALLFGLSLSNHWPLMVLVAPAFAVLLWPVRRELLRGAPLLVWLFLLGLLPYVWMVYRSWKALPVSFYGPLDNLPKIWFFLSREGYSEIDHSPSADWLDRIKFFRFFGGQLLLQFALLGTLLAAAGFAVQWRLLGRRIGAFLTVAFLMPSVVLLLLLGFDYSSISKHVFHVYPLPAYAVGALWMGLGFAWLRQRYALRRPHALAAGVSLLALIFAVGARQNVLTDHGWGARYAQTMLALFPRNAAVFARGEVDLGPMAYYHMIENQRPDITLYQTKGLILGNRLIDPLNTDERTRNRALRDAVTQQTDPVVSTVEVFTGFARRDRWLFSEVDKQREPHSVIVDIPEQAVHFFEESVLGAKDANAWIAFCQGQLRRRYAQLLAQSLRRSQPPDARTARHLDLLARDFYGALGIAEGLMLNTEGYPAGVVVGYLDKARQLMPSDVAKDELSRFFRLRGEIRTLIGDETGAIADLESAWSVWQTADNEALKRLEELYRKKGDDAALSAVQARVKHHRRMRP